MTKAINKLLAITLSFAMILTSFTLLGGAVAVNADDGDKPGLILFAGNNQPAAGGKFIWSYWGEDDSADLFGLAATDFGVQFREGEGDWQTSNASLTIGSDDTYTYDGIITADIPDNEDAVEKQWRLTYSGEIYDQEGNTIECPTITQAAAEKTPISKPVNVVISRGDGETEDAQYQPASGGTYIWTVQDANYGKLAGIIDEDDFVLQTQKGAAPSDGDWTESSVGTLSIEVIEDEEYGWDSAIVTATIPNNQDEYDKSWRIAYKYTEPSTQYETCGAEFYTQMKLEAPADPEITDATVTPSEVEKYTDEVVVSVKGANLEKVWYRAFKYNEEDDYWYRMGSSYNADSVDAINADSAEIKYAPTDEASKYRIYVMPTDPGTGDLSVSACEKKYKSVEWTAKGAPQATINEVSVDPEEVTSASDSVTLTVTGENLDTVWYVLFYCEPGDDYWMRDTAKSFTAETAEKATTTISSTKDADKFLVYVMTKDPGYSYYSESSCKSAGFKSAGWTVKPAPQSVWNEDCFTYSDDNTTITGLSDAGKEAIKEDSVMVLPEKRNGVEVTAIAASAFANNQDITGVVFPASIKTIGNMAFNLTNSLESITFEGTAITTIPQSAFGKTVIGKSIKKLVIPEGVETIGNNAFGGSLIEELVLPSTLKTIGQRAFMNNKLSTLIIPDGVTSIEKEAFSQANAKAKNTLTSLTLGSKVDTIGQYAFRYCNLSSVDIPTSVKTLNTDAFKDNVSTVILNLTNEDQFTSSGDYTNFIADGSGHRSVYEGKMNYEISFVSGSGRRAKNPVFTKNGKLTETDLAAPYTSNKYDVFEGWFTDESEGEKIDSSTVFEAAATLYAHWSENEALKELEAEVDTTSQTVEEAKAAADKAAETRNEDDIKDALEKASAANELADSTKSKVSETLSAYKDNPVYGQTAVAAVRVADNKADTAVQSAAESKATATKVDAEVASETATKLAAEAAKAEFGTQNAVDKAEAAKKAADEALEKAKAAAEAAEKAYGADSDQAKAAAETVTTAEDAATKAADAVTKAEDTKAAVEAEAAAAEAKDAADKAAEDAAKAEPGTQDAVDKAEAAKKAADEALEKAKAAAGAAEKAYGADSDKAKEAAEAVTAAEEAATNAETAVTAATEKKAAVDDAIKATAEAAEAKDAADKAADEAAKAEPGTQDAVDKAEAAKKAADEALDKAKVAAEAAEKAYGADSDQAKAAANAVTSAQETADKAGTAKSDAEQAKVDADKKAADDKAKADAEAKAKKVKTVTVNVKTVNAKAIDAAVKKADGSNKYVTKIVLGKNVKTVKAKAFSKYKKVTTIQVKTKKLKKSSVKNALKGSKVKTVQVKVGSKKVNKKYVKTYKKIFTKKIAGKKVTVK